MLADEILYEGSVQQTLDFITLDFAISSLPWNLAKYLAISAANFFGRWWTVDHPDNFQFIIDKSYDKKEGDARAEWQKYMKKKKTVKTVKNLSVTKK